MCLGIPGQVVEMYGAEGLPMGVVDFGGPDVPGFTWGESMGGIHSSILGPLEPSIMAAAPTAGGAGLSDVGIRTMMNTVERAVMLRTMGPLIVGEAVDDNRMKIHLVVPLSNDQRRMTIGMAEGVAATVSHRCLSVGWRLNAILPLFHKGL